MRRAIVVVTLLCLTGCGEDQEQRAKEAAHIAIAKADKARAEKLSTFQAHRDEIVAKVRALVASKDWDAASVESSKWRELGDRELLALALQIEGERDKIWKAKQEQQNKIALAERLKAEKERREEEKREKARRKKEGVSIGMTQDEVIMSSWGKPQSINRTVYTFGVKEQWVYPGSQYLYFDDGKLTTIQHNRR